jgi:hypothetical protein
MNYKYISDTQFRCEILENYTETFCLCGKINGHNILAVSENKFHLTLGDG